MDYQRLTEIWMNIDWLVILREWLPLLIAVAFVVKKFYGAGVGALKFGRMKIMKRAAYFRGWRYRRSLAKATRQLRKIVEGIIGTSAYSDKNRGGEVDYQRAIRLEAGKAHVIDEGSGHVITKVAKCGGGYARVEILDKKLRPEIMNPNDFPVILEYRYVQRRPEPKLSLKGHGIDNITIDEEAAKPKHDLYSREEVDALLGQGIKITHWPGRATTEDARLKGFVHSIDVQCSIDDDFDYALATINLLSGGSCVIRKSLEELDNVECGMLIQFAAEDVIEWIPST